ncbi:hypothetical protein GGR93_003366 [Sulfitobacter noctilucicola]|uniref:Transposase DDE domain-containing protein n=1 Tax=Sulfitobacter noctilucicola TaxID=1342301 RepID=A0A7W6MAN8_9RHOB|nr:hypothetical protein [Sulfitobacter noctilucicola]
MLIAYLKRILWLGRLRLRGPCGANDEFLLAATAQNLRKLAKIFPAPQQMRKALKDGRLRDVQGGTFCARNTLFVRRISPTAQCFCNAANVGFHNWIQNLFTKQRAFYKVVGILIRLMRSF